MAQTVITPIRRWLEPVERRFDGHAWLAALTIAFLAGVIRIINLVTPNQEFFDEVYYPNDANDMLTHGVEWDVNANGPGYVVHPPLGNG